MSIFLMSIFRLDGLIAVVAATLQRLQQLRGAESISIFLFPARQPQNQVVTNGRVPTLKFFAYSAETGAPPLTNADTSRTIRPSERLYVRAGLRKLIDFAGFLWSRPPDSNRRPADYESAAEITSLVRI